MTDERADSEVPIYRHDEPVEGEISAGDPELVAAIEAHVTRHFGEPTQVWHERISPYVHVDVHVVEPSEQRPAYTLVTSGMSERPMRSKAGDCHAELMMALPPTWPAIDSDEFREPRGYWPYELLQNLARLPHAFDTLLWSGHTVPNGDPPEPYAPGTKLCGALLAPLVTAPDGFKTLVVGEREIHFFAVIPLHADEMRVKLDQGLDRLYDLLDDVELTELLDVNRPSAVPRRRGIFRR